MPVPRIDIFALSERLMAMDDAAWARHANPLSVYSRVSILPLMTLAVWSHLWLGWGALAPVALVLIWTWWNPRAFGPPATTDSWAARGTFGERVFLNRAKVPIPPHHAQWARILTLVSGLGVVPWVYGVWQLDPGLTLFGLSLMVGGKLWFFDRMVWLYQDMQAQRPEYAKWLH
ncbi:MULTISPECIES: DUF6653 family protein [Phaeobacter]|uniref:Uncharacterized protein n=1 Tax=Phaeobacter gallaeciensis TaxID=60890 RepID=A0ABD4XCH2_9RHOB|nr:DUF6653 family protein [Phaeobacter gallaeciensis]MDF1773212.1 hypothetical protein [Pseudophaeobacter sp. bin_em_oilr2.035]MDE4145669.1 hypothetical protein [Phaeobacter gallaeciensis]MDE4158340.1 hypothetical protein [Phaeobacter gallaeciensis]MDE4162519.1 hypothetical protein [Phaeobacter gallaeciensis]MDE4166745.1 hypothetical protein [Phaeobacter gallaeciensis]